MSPERNLLTISQLNASIKTALEGTMGTVWLTGEISNFTCPASGHLYFSLKDQQSQVRCAMFRGFNRYLKFSPKNGEQVVAKAKPTLYTPRGDYQLLVEYLEPAGAGLLQQQFAATKQKLEQAGLFASEYKQALPLFPKAIGIVTSATGAAVRDILITLKNRYPLAPVYLYPCQVQGATASREIVQAIEQANHHACVDVLLLARGGGSLEDLWCFNEENVAYAIHQSRIPIISGVGHETDTTICDFVADHRAATPTAAAQAACPERHILLEKIQHYHAQLTRHMQQRLSTIQAHVNWLNKCLKHPQQHIEIKAQQLDMLESRLLKAIHQRINTDKLRIANRLQQITRQSPIQRLQQQRLQIQQLQNQIKQSIQQRLHMKQQQLARLATALDAISPLSTLQRGYAIVEHQGNVIRSADAVKPGESLHIRLQRGTLHCTVTEKTITPQPSHI